MYLYLYDYSYVHVEQNVWSCECVSVSLYLCVYLCAYLCACVCVREREREGEREGERDYRLCKHSTAHAYDVASFERAFTCVHKCECS